LEQAFFCPKAIGEARKFMVKSVQKGLVTPQMQNWIEFERFDEKLKIVEK